MFRGVKSLFAIAATGFVLEIVKERREIGILKKEKEEQQKKIKQLLVNQNLGVYTVGANGNSYFKERAVSIPTIPTIMDLKIYGYKLKNFGDMAAYQPFDTGERFKDDPLVYLKAMEDGAAIDSKNGILYVGIPEKIIID